MGQVTPCVPFPGHVGSRGYGQIGRNTYAHVAAWTLQNGAVPRGMVVRHKCDNPPCVNPEHLEIGTRKQNSQDMAERDRSTFYEKNPQAVLTQEEARQIRCLRALGVTGRWCALTYGVSPSTVSFVKRGKTWAQRERKN